MNMTTMGRLIAMKRVRNILLLVAIDGSESSKNALRQSIRFARDHHCGVTAVTVIPSYEGDIDLIGVRNIREAFKEPGEKVLEEARKIATQEGVEIYTFLEEGNIHEAIIDVAQSRDCDLIVMGRRGLTGIERVLMGSVTARVIGYSPIDVLVMPEKSVIKWGKILLAVDGSKYSDVAASRAITFAQTYGRTLDILSVVDVPPEAYGEAPDFVDKMVEKAREIAETVENTAKVAKISATSFVRDGDAPEKILDLAKKLESDVIVMGSHGHTGLKRLLMGSVTERVIGHAPCPVLVVKSS
ncbi:MAG: universal stress protein [Firmicutes bacterium]|nr:universal stress protein [Bacillota bacterium]